jgi:NADH:ubiquinone oxidoreductase subunit 3 (subunit A)
LPGALFARQEYGNIPSAGTTLRDVKQRGLVVAMIFVVLAIWLVGAAVTKYSLEQMAYYTPIAVVVVGATVGLVLLWVKIVLDSLRRHRSN